MKYSASQLSQAWKSYLASRGTQRKQQGGPILPTGDNLGHAGPSLLEQPKRQLSPEQIYTPGQPIRIADTLSHPVAGSYEKFLKTQDRFDTAASPGAGTFGKGMNGLPMALGVKGMNNGGKVKKFKKKKKQEGEATPVADAQVEHRGAASGGGQHRQDGGIVEGKGGIDTNPAAIRPGSFVVPKKKVPEAIKDGIVSTKTANKAQAGGVPVKLTAGEAIVSPEKAKGLYDMGVDLNQYAPDSEYPYTPATGQKELNPSLLRNQWRSDSTKEYHTADSIINTTDDAKMKEDMMRDFYEQKKQDGGGVSDVQMAAPVAVDISTNKPRLKGKALSLPKRGIEQPSDTIQAKSPYSYLWQSDKDIKRAADVYGLDWSGLPSTKSTEEQTPAPLKFQDGGTPPADVFPIGNQPYANNENAQMSIAAGKDPNAVNPNNITLPGVDPSKAYKPKTTQQSLLGDVAQEEKNYYAEAGLLNLGMLAGNLGSQYVAKPKPLPYQPDIYQRNIAAQFESANKDLDKEAATARYNARNMGVTRTPDIDANLMDKRLSLGAQLDTEKENERKSVYEQRNQASLFNLNQNNQYASNEADRLAQFRQEKGQVAGQYIDKLQNLYKTSIEDKYRIAGTQNQYDQQKKYIDSGNASMIGSMILTPNGITPTGDLAKDTVSAQQVQKLQGANLIDKWNTSRASNPSLTIDQFMKDNNIQ